MSNRSAKVAATFLASTILAWANFASVTNVQAQTAVDKCLTAPKGATPEGSHWYYRLERGTKRQCWYLRDESDKSARAAPQDSSAEATSDSAAADPAPPPPRPAVRKTVANARAELTSPQQRVERQPVAVAEPRTVGMTPAAPVSQSSPAADRPDAATPSSTVATRWLDSTSMTSSNSFRSAAAEPPAAPPEINQAATPRGPAPLALAAADSSMTKQTASLQMLFLVIAGALALAGITASLLFRLGSARARRSEVRRDRRAIWDQVNERPSMRPVEEVPVWRRSHSPNPPAPEDHPERRVTEMLSRLARSAQN